MKTFGEIAFFLGITAFLAVEFFILFHFVIKYW